MKKEMGSLSEVSKGNVCGFRILGRVSLSSEKCFRNGHQGSDRHSFQSQIRHTSARRLPGRESRGLNK